MQRYYTPEREDVVDDYHGHAVSDPYRYFEDPSDPRTVEFIEENNKRVDKVIQRYRIEYYKKRFAEIYEGYTRFNALTNHGNGIYSYYKYEGVRPQPEIHVVINGGDRVVLDVNTLSEDGTTAVTGKSVSPDGRYFTCTVSVHGSDWQSVHVYELESGELLDVLQWVRFTLPAWEEDGEGFFYQKYPDQTLVAEDLKNKDGRLFYHKVGTAQQDDLEVFRPDSIEESLFPRIYNGHLFVSVNNSTMPRNKLYYRVKGSKSFVPMIKEYNGFMYSPIGASESHIFLLTTENAPNRKIIKLPFGETDIGKAQTVVHEKESVINMATLTRQGVACVYTKDVAHELVIVPYDDGDEVKVDLPTRGTVTFLSGKYKDSTLFVAFHSFFYPHTNFVYRGEKLEVFLTPVVPVDTSLYESRQVFYTSKDRTQIPMYIIHKKGLELNGKNPTLLYAYGGFNIAQMPSFTPYLIQWLDDGGVYALANIRGGGEYGKMWHEQALLEKKQNVFDDFIAAAEYLIQEKYTSSEKLAINGRSNGGLLIGAVLTQRPELFGAAVPQVGVLDMLRYHKYTIGRYWIPEYGTSENPDHFKFLIKYSPLHNIKEARYPPTLVTAAEGDNRVDPAHTLKFSAELQHKQQGGAPILMRIERKAGHGFGKPMTKVIEDLSYKFAFISQMLGLEVNFTTE